MNTSYKERLHALETILEEGNIVFFGGAGVSTESGIPDFRSTDGLYNTEYAYPPEEIISHTFFYRNPAEFYRFYKKKCSFQRQSQIFVISGLQSWKKGGFCARSSRKTSTDYTKRQGVKRFLNCMAAYGTIIV